MQNLFINKVVGIVMATLEKTGLLTKEWHLGKVKTVGVGVLDVYVDGSEIPTPNVPCNPNIPFAIGDEVWVQFINRDNKNLFITSKRNVGGNDYEAPYGITASSTSFSPTGNVASTNVQDAIAELDTEKLSKTGGSVGKLTLTSPSLEGDTTKIRMYRNLATYSFDAGNVTGAIVLELPYGFVNIMHKITIDGYFYETSYSPLKLECSFYNYNYNGGMFYYPQYTISSNKNIMVRYARNTVSGNVCVILGDTGTVWSYPKLIVSNVLSSFRELTTDYSSNWTFSVKTDLSTYDKLTTATNSNYIPPATSIVNTPAGNISATTIQGAIDELDTEKASNTVATQSTNGLHSATDKIKLDGISAGANKTEQSTTNGNIKIDNVEKAVYVHPTNHSPSIITQDANNRFVTDTQISTWNAKASTTVATASTNGLMSSTDKQDLTALSTWKVNLQSTDILWSGALYMNDTQIITPTKALSECDKGWLLIWSDYDAGVGANNYDWSSSTFIPKIYGTSPIAGSRTMSLIPTFHSDTSVQFTIKTLLISNTQITGHASNDSADANVLASDVVLRYVIAW